MYNYLDYVNLQNETVLAAIRETASVANFSFNMSNNYLEDQERKMRIQSIYVSYKMYI